jgi:hypothetical protein
MIRKEGLEMKRLLGLLLVVVLMAVAAVRV